MNEEKEIGPGEAQRVLHDRGWRWRIWRHRVVGWTCPRCLTRASLRVVH